MVMEDLLPVLRILQMVTALFSAEKTTSASMVYPTLWKLRSRDLCPAEGDSPADAVFKVGLIHSFKYIFSGVVIVRPTLLNIALFYFLFFIIFIRT